MNKQHNLCRLVVACLLLFPIVASSQGGSCETVINRIGSDEIILAAEAGTSEAQLPVYPLTGNEVASFTGALETSDPPNTIDYRADNSAGSENPETCAAVTTNVRYDAYSFVAGSSGTVELAKGGTEDPQYSFSIFAGSFDPDNGCATWVASSSTTGPAISRSSIVFDVVGGETYFVVVAAQEAVAAPGLSYTLNVVPPAPELYEGTPLPTDHDYTYLVTTAGDTVIVAQSPTADFRTLNAGDYEVYGVEYDTTSNDPTTFPGQSLSGIQSSGGNPTCLRMSENSLFLLVADAAAPVDWLDFRAVTRTGGIELQWEVASETENDYFRVERSVDGTQWEALDEVAGNGTRNLYAAFQYLDATPANGTNFYRLAQVDFDGTVDFSAVVTAVWVAPEAGLFSFPNPFTSRLTVRSSIDLAGQPRLFDLQGRDLGQQLSITVEGRQAIVETDSLPVGVYILQWGDEQLRVVKN